MDNLWGRLEKEADLAGREKKNLCWEWGEEALKNHNQKMMISLESKRTWSLKKKDKKTKPVKANTKW